MTLHNGSEAWRPARRLARRSGVAKMAMAAILLSGAAACSEDDDTAGASKAEFLADANAICESGNAAIDARMAAVGENPTDEQLAGLVDYIVDNVTAQVEDQRALAVPEELRGDMEGIWADVTAILADMRAQGPSVLQGEDPLASVRPRLASIGLTDCA